MLLCVAGGFLSSFYSLDRLFLASDIQGNLRHRLLKDKDDLPGKIEPAMKPSRFGQTWGSADPKWRPPFRTFFGKVVGETTRKMGLI